MSRTWFITGATRGLGEQIARAALLGGDRVVATGRDKEALRAKFGPDTEILITQELDVRSGESASQAVGAAVEKFGSIDVLVNNAGYAHLGFFEEFDPGDAQAQYATNVFGVFNVTWAVLPVMRRQRSGKIVNLSSLAGLVGVEGRTLYSSSKHAIEGFSEALAMEVARFGISVMILEPGQFRTEGMSESSVRFGENRIDDYLAASGELRDYFRELDGRQAGDPQKLAAVVVELVRQRSDLLRIPLGRDAVEVFKKKISGLQDAIDSAASVPDLLNLLAAD